MGLWNSVAPHRFENSVEDLVEAWEARRVSGESSLEDFWQSRSRSHPASTLTALIKLDLKRRFDNGERPRVADYLDRFPKLKENSDQVVSLVYEEFCLRQEIGEETDSREFCEAYGPWRDSLLSQIAYHRELSLAVDPATSPRYPDPGDQFDQYKLIKVLGTGAVAKVFLATEEDLGDRKIVIKVSNSFGQEPTILARLKHRNIVPILTYARSESGLRGICMPYRSGLTLEDLIVRIGRGTPPSSAKRIRELLRSTETLAETPVDPVRPGWDNFPNDRPFSEAVAWIGLALSDALDYLHRQGILHRDIKPANILLAHEDGPQLLDFNLSQDPGAPDHVRASMKGGTLPYMAPEHLQAFLEASAWKGVGASADIYSLGLVLRELATGRAPDLPDTSLTLPRAIQGLIVHRSHPRTSARQINPSIPPSLDAILEKCLAFDSANRYASANELSEDLRLFLGRRPLKHASNSSRVERASNWIHRNQFWLGPILLCSLVYYGFVSFASKPPALIQERSEFRQAIKQLDSSAEQDWDKARATFEQFHNDHPESAWPALYLGLVIDKQTKKSGKADSRQQEESRVLINEACEKPHAEQALLERLKVEPDSTMLQTKYAILLTKPAAHDDDRRTKSERDNEARQFFERVLEVDPNRISALTALIGLERELGSYEKAFNLTSKAIKILTQAKASGEDIYGFRLLQLSILHQLSDQIFKTSFTPADRLMAAPRLDTIESTLAAMSDEMTKMKVGQGSRVHLYLVPLYRGCVASGRGVLAADAGHREVALNCFYQADRQFAEAYKQASTLLSNRDKYQTAVLEQQQTLKARRDRFLKD